MDLSERGVDGPPELLEAGFKICQLAAPRANRSATSVTSQPTVLCGRLNGASAPETVGAEGVESSVAVAFDRTPAQMSGDRHQ